MTSTEENTNKKAKKDSNEELETFLKTLPILPSLIDAKGCNLIILHAEDTRDNQVFLIPPGDDWNQISILARTLSYWTRSKWYYQEQVIANADRTLQQLYTALDKYVDGCIEPESSFINVGPSCMQVVTFW